MDSICGIVGAWLGLELLGVEAVYCSPLNLGSGTVASEQGRLPVPAAATAVLLRGVPVYARGPEAELTTPTGTVPLPKFATSGGGAVSGCPAAIRRVGARRNSRTPMPLLGTNPAAL